MSKEYVLTEEGLKNLEEELEQLKTVKRKETTEKLKIARGFGDLSENSEYDEAKNEQAMVESRIASLEAMLKNVRVMDIDELSTDTISVGCKIKLKDIEFDEEITYSIVGSTEADPANGRISNESPVGKALLGHKVGETVTVEAPGGDIKFEVLEITK